MQVYRPGDNSNPIELTVAVPVELPLEPVQLPLKAKGFAPIPLLLSAVEWRCYEHDDYHS